MKWFRKGTLLLGLVLLFVFCPSALCQVRTETPIRAVLSVDSAGVKTTQVSPSPVPVSIGVSNIELETNASGGALAPGYVQSNVSPKCHWVKFHFSGTKWTWLVRKPGSYAAKALTGCIQSSGHVLVKFRRFDRLCCTDGSGQQLETYYAVSSPTCGIDGLNWMTPQQINQYQIYLHQPQYMWSSWALWQKIIVNRYIKAAEFKDNAIITIDLLNNLAWIESENIGEFPALK